MKGPHFGGSDEEAALLVQQGDKEKFGILMDRYEDKLFRYARKFIGGNERVEDLVQEAFIRAYRNIQSFDAKRKFSPWIYRIAHNICVNALKKRSRTPIVFFNFDTFAAHPAHEESAETGIEKHEREEMRKMIKTGLAALAPSYREVVILYYLEDLSYKEIAEILHVPIGTVGIRLSRAKEALRKECEKLGYEHGN